jgi:uncharacterized protein (TIGR00645 family)
MPLSASFRPLVATFISMESRNIPKVCHPGSCAQTGPASITDPLIKHSRGQVMKSLELIVERIILSSRWLLVVFYLGLAMSLAVYAVSFGYKFYKVTINVFTYDEGEMILAMLGLIDAALVASLVVMVMISGYENFVSRFDETEADVSFIGKLDAGSLKIKVASSIVAISSIHLLQVFLNSDRFTDGKIMWLTAMHLAFVVSAVMLGFLEQLMKKTKDTSKI